MLDLITLICVIILIYIVLKNTINHPQILSLNPSTSVDLMSGSYHSLFTIDRLIVIMALNFETTHEYHLDGADLFYCEEHECLMLTPDYSDTIRISGVSYETMLKFATKLYREDLNKTLEDIKLKDPEESEVTSQYGTIERVRIPLLALG